MEEMEQAVKTVEKEAAHVYSAMKNKKEDNRSCRICYSLTNPFNMEDDLISPCDCRGSMEFVHNACLRVWRYRRRKVNDVEKCEQCSAIYKFDSEVFPHAMVTLFISVAILGTMYLAFTLIFRLLVDIFVTVIRNFFFADIYMFIDFGVGKSLDYVFTKKQFIIDNSYRFTKLGYTAHLFIMLLSYQILTRLSFFSVFNYTFTFWRVVQFNFVIDNMLFGIMSIYYMKKAYEDIHCRVCFILTFFLNCRKFSVYSVLLKTSNFQI